jgi:hypothetical protein
MCKLSTQYIEIMLDIILRLWYIQNTPRFQKLDLAASSDVVGEGS